MRLGIGGIVLARCADIDNPSKPERFAESALMQLGIGGIALARRCRCADTDNPSKPPFEKGGLAGIPLRHLDTSQANAIGLRHG